jgi:hypothetical protein
VSHRLDRRNADGHLQATTTLSLERSRCSWTRSFLLLGPLRNSLAETASHTAFFFLDNCYRRSVCHPVQKLREHPLDGLALPVEQRSHPALKPSLAAAYAWPLHRDRPQLSGQPPQVSMPLAIAGHCINLATSLGFLPSQNTVTFLSKIYWINP